MPENPRWWSPERVICFMLRRFLRTNAIPMTELIKMNKQERLNLIKSMKKTKIYNSQYVVESASKVESIDETLVRLIHEFELVQKELKVKIHNKEFLITGYNKKIITTQHPSCIDYLILAFYDDQFKLVVQYFMDTCPKYIISGNGKIASIGSENETVVLGPHCISIDSPINIEAGKQFVIKLSLDGNGLDKGKIWFGCFMADSIKNVKNHVINWNCRWRQSTCYYQALFAKHSRDDYCRQYTNLPNDADAMMEFSCNAITPSILSKDIWTIKINLIKMNMIVYYNGIKIRNLKLHSTVMIKYILPVFAVITTKKHSIRIIDSYIH